MAIFIHIWNISAFLFLFCLVTYLLVQLLINCLPENNLLKRYGQSYALITGGSSGIGKEMAEKLAGQGFDVIIVGSTSSHLSETVEYVHQKHPNTKIVSIQADFTTDCETVANGIIEQVKNLDVSVLALNAGFGTFESAASPSISTQQMLNANVTTHLKLFYSLFPSIIKRGGEKNKNKGLISFTSSALAILPTPFTTAYSSSKAYWELFGETLSAEARCYGIDVVVLLPGPVSTRFHTRLPQLYTMDMVNMVSQSPATIASLLLRAAGRFNVVDAGWMPIFCRILLKFLDLNIYLKLASFVVPFLGDAKQAFLKKKTSEKTAENE